jgi:hypothetical protein
MAVWLNTAWLLACLPESRAFQRATRRVAATQAGLLRQILRANRDTDFGRRHRFAAIADPRTFQDRVPLSRYEDNRGAVERIAAGEPNVLTRDPVELLEPTSGTTAGEKLIPFTAALRRQFRRPVAVWMADLLWHLPALRRGRAYWSVSPPLSRARRTAGGVRVGFDDDASYLGGWERFVLSRLLVRPPRCGQPREPEAFRYATLLALLAAEDLALISVWNPTFLTALFAHFDDWQDRLCRDLHGGAAPLGRATAVARALAGGEPLGVRLRRVWPSLALVSCWADAAAALGLDDVRSLFPGVPIQPKGLLATEGVVSVPLLGLPGAALALRSHFFEFEEAGAERPRLAHEVERSGRYRVVLTTGGGLYRYRLCDEVLVVGRLHGCPLLRFLGKADRVSDLVGEKLAEVHVRQVIERALAARGWSVRFALLVPVPGRPSGYALYLQGPGVGDDADALAADVEAGLAENPHYRDAVALGQLRAVRVCLLRADGPAAWPIYEAACLERGQKLGDIKPAVLDAWTGWPERLRPLML